MSAGNHHQPPQSGAAVDGATLHLRVAEACSEAAMFVQALQNAISRLAQDTSTMDPDVLRDLQRTDLVGQIMAALARLHTGLAEAGPGASYDAEQIASWIKLDSLAERLMDPKCGLADTESNTESSVTLF